MTDAERIAKLEAEIEKLKAQTKPPDRAVVDSYIFPTTLRAIDRAGMDRASEQAMRDAVRGWDPMEDVRRGQVSHVSQSGPSVVEVKSRGWIDDRPKEVAGGKQAQDLIDGIAQKFEPMPKAGKPKDAA